MFKRLFLFVFIYSSLKGDINRPTTATITSYSETFNSLARESGVMTPANNVFVNDRINDLIYYKNYYKSCDQSKVRSLIVMGLFVIPIIAKLYYDSKQTIDDKLDKLNTKRSELEARIQAEQEQKQQDEAAHKAEVLAKAHEELDALPSKKAVVLKAICGTIFNSFISLLTDPFSIKSSLTIMACSAATAYYYKNYRDFAGQKFRNISNLLHLLMNNFTNKAGILKSPIPAPEIMQKVGVIDNQIASIVNRYEIDNNLKKKLISFLEMLVRFIKE